MPQVKCRICTNEFYAKPSHIRLGYGKYCSDACRHIGQRKGKYVRCAVCEKKVWKMPKALKASKSGKFFCDKSCQTVWRNKFFSGKRHPLWQGGEYTYYKVMAQHKIPQVCNSCGLRDKRVLIIHHIDHNRKKNEINNLRWLCRNCHHLIHLKEGYIKNK